MNIDLTQVTDLLNRLIHQLERLEELESSSEKSKISLYSSKQAAKMLGTTERSLFNYRQNGLEYIQIGRKIMFMEDHLIEFLNDHLINNGKSSN